MRVSFGSVLLFRKVSKMARWLVVKVINEDLTDLYLNINQGIGVDAMEVDKTELNIAHVERLGDD